MASAYEQQPEGRGWFARLHLSWPMLLLAGWVMYEFTAQPGLAALVVCAKFGWADVRTAFWLRRVDPDRPRGQTCFWAYLAYGLWKVALMATLTMIVFGLVTTLMAQKARQPQPNNDFSPVLGGALAAALVGCGLLFPIAYVALWSALRNGVRIWLGHAPARARRERFWPPQHGRVNAAPYVGFTQLMLTMWFFLLFLVGLVAAIPQPGLWGILLLIGTPVLLIVTPIALMRLSARVIARSPQECWTAEEEEMVYQAPTAEGEVGEA